eukprot:CAMPEP_0201105986 /NCGR_PEP_ID=MMETSP0812-20130820/49025_1 /ASSEMBLY_ACC=CAM_ASM_000668 /TAXON_ID=98059 /ORGANISM="Dinobryon sp., Strain UTEXLB2267" /LENGTH=205 /DNA_ID=CAMNT_0047366125 /DNA_START=82 /DNA_END=699 /DNA_ORIENTATION=+
MVSNEQKAIEIDTAKVIAQTELIKSFLSISDYQLDIMFCSDYKIRRLNRDLREISKSTDILSVPINEFTYPGVFEEDQSNVGEKHLGDIAICPSYVMRQCARDLKYHEARPKNSPRDESVDAGISLAMESGYFTLEERIPLLLIHGILHLLGYDHETDEEWAQMTKEEDRLLNLFLEAQKPSMVTSLDRIGDDAIVTKPKKKSKK